MEKLILTCGRYIPPSAGDSEIRVRAMEAYLARLSEELEILLGEAGRMLEALRSGQTASDVNDHSNSGEGGM